MSVATANIRNAQVICSTSQQAKLNNVDYGTSKKILKDENSSPTIKSEYADSPSTINQSQNSLSNSNVNGTTNQHSSQNHTDMEFAQNVTTTSTTGMCPAVNGTMSSNGTYANMNGTNHAAINGLTNGFQQQYSGSNAAMNGMTQNNLDPTGPLPNEIFELLNEFWRPNDLVNLDGHSMNGKMARRSPDGSLEDTPEEEKDGEDDISSIADTEMGVDRNTQKRRYSRLSDGYERLKSVLPSVKDKRRVSKARILDEAINYIQRLESITNVLKREHEKRLSMLNGSNGFFPDYTVQPYMRSLFQKQMYPPGLSTTKMNQYPKMSTTPSAMPKSPRMKQYNQQYSSQPPGMGVGTNINGTDYNYNNINSYSGTNSMYQSSDPGQIMNGDTSPITNNSPYSACSLSPGSTPSTYQNNSVVNNSWPYQGGTLSGYDGNTSQLSSYSQGRQNSSSAYGNTSYSNLNGSMWGSMGGMNDATPQVLPHTDHSMKVG